jgi:hypothetical protein
LREEEENAKKSSKHNVQAVTRFCYEVDFPPLMKYKAHCIWKNEELTSLLGVSPARETSPGGRPDSPTVGGASVILTSRRVTSSFREKKGGDGPRQQRSGCYILVAGDLAETAALERALEAAGIDWAVPTLLITECVLVYMEAEASRALVEVSGASSVAAIRSGGEKSCGRMPWSVVGKCLDSAGEDGKGFLIRGQV